jgi:hypothetical protein
MVMTTREIDANAMLRKIEEIDRTPRGFRDLYESQQRGVTHLYESDATQFVAPMGYGKTAVALTAIGELITDKIIRRALTIAPKRVAQLVWPQEQKLWRHLHDLRVKPITGGSLERAQKLMENDADVYVIGVDHVPWLVQLLRNVPAEHPVFDCLVIDELSRFKNPRGVWSKGMRAIASKFRIRWGLTGTPRPNGYIDQFAPLSIISANRLWGKSFDPWREQHFIATDYQRYNWEIRPDHVALLEKDIDLYTATVSDDDLEELPELVLRDHWVDLPEIVGVNYKQMEKKLAAEIEAETVVAANMGVATVKLAQVVQGFLYGEQKQGHDPHGVKEALLEGFRYGKYRQAHYLHGVKEALLEELVEDLSGDPVLIVYEFHEDLSRLRKKWPDLRWLGQGTTDRQARDNKRDWNARQLPMLALHPAAAGHGLNLQHGGNQMIWYGMTWSAEMYEQTIKRFHRQGQKQRCFVHRILARDTIDEAKLLRVDQKLTEQEAFRRYLRKV